MNYKASLFKSRILTANSFFIIISTFFIVWRASTAVYVFYLGCQLIKLISSLLKIKKVTFRAISMLRLPNRKVSSKNQGLSSLSSNEKKAMTIPKVLSLKLLIFGIATFVYWIWKPSFLANSRCIVFTLLHESIRACTNSLSTYINYYI